MSLFMLLHHLKRAMWIDGSTLKLKRSSRHNSKVVGPQISQYHFVPTIPMIDMGQLLYHITNYTESIVQSNFGSLRMLYSH